MATAIPALVRAMLAIIAILALLLVSSPTVVQAQDSTVTHTVRSGETLWSLATRFYGDGHRWHDLSRLNGLGANGEKGLTVGQVIKVPAGKGAKAAAADAKPLAETPAQKAAAEKPAAEKPGIDKPVAEKAVAVKPKTGDDKTAGGALASQTAGKADAPAKAPTKPAARTAAKNAPSKTAKSADSKPTLVASDSVQAAKGTGNANSANAESVAPAHTRIWSVEIPAQRAARGKDVATVFQGHTYDREEVVTGTPTATMSEAPRARVGEYEGAPFPMPDGRFVSAGRVGRRVGAATAGSSREVERLILADESEVQLPSGSAASVGARFVAVTMGPVLASGTSLAIPTGVLQVVRADAGKAVVARVVRQSGLIEQGQHLFPVEGAAASATATATPLPAGSAGPASTVLWVQDGALLPSLQSYLVLGATERDGVRAGDEFWLVSKQGVGVDAREQRIAVARVVRVTSAGSTAIVIRQDQPLIAVGVSARRVAKVN